MEWLANNPPAAKGVATLILMAIAVTGFWLGRKQLIVGIPLTLCALLVAAIALPGAIPARYTAERNNCINNLRLIRKAKEEWAQVNNKQPIDQPTFQDLHGNGGTNGFLRRQVSCPSGGVYTLGAVAVSPSCSLSEKGHWLDKQK